MFACVPVYNCKCILRTHAARNTTATTTTTTATASTTTTAVVVVAAAAALEAAALRVYLRFSGVKARFRSVSTYRVHFSTAFGLVMKALVLTCFL